MSLFLVPVVLNSLGALECCLESGDIWGRGSGAGV